MRMGDLPLLSIVTEPVIGESINVLWSFIVLLISSKVTKYLYITFEAKGAWEGLKG